MATGERHYPGEPIRTAGRITGVDAPTPKRYGRGLFLATVAGGLTSIAWAKPVWTKVSAALGPAESLVPFVPQGWRIYTVSGSMPKIDRATWRPEVGGVGTPKAPVPPC